MSIRIKAIGASGAGKGVLLKFIADACEKAGCRIDKATEEYAIQVCDIPFDKLKQ
jgi:type IV secretory pathway VirB4 component